MVIMIIEELDIKEFRGIRKCDKPLKFSNITVLIGRNNSGKSTILEALSLLPKPDVPDYIDKNQKIKFLANSHKSDKEGYRSLIYFYSGTSTITYSFANPKDIVELKIQEDNYSFESRTENPGFGNSSPFGSFGSSDPVFKHLSQIMIDVFMNNGDKDLTGLVFYVPYDTDFIRKFEAKMEELKSLINKKGIHVTVTELINQSIDDKYSDIAFLKPISIRKVFPDGKSRYLDLHDLGSGIESIIKIMAVIEAVQPKLLLIDDFGAALHPSLIKIFLTWLSKGKWQTILSTHSIDVLYNLVEVAPEDTSIIQLRKSDEDILKYHVLSLEQLEDVFSANHDPRLLVDRLNL